MRNAINSFIKSVLMTILSLTIAGCSQHAAFGQEAQSNDDTTQKRAGISNNDKAENSTRSDTWTADTTVGEIVAARPATGRIFELVGIDYCCGGQVQLKKAALNKGIDTNQLLSALHVVNATSSTSPERDWTEEPLSELMDHIVTTHHAWLRRELPLLLATTQTVLRVHGDSHPELAEVSETLTKINGAVLPHLDEEETTVFPALRKLAGGNPPDGIESQLVALRSDHDELGAPVESLA